MNFPDEAKLITGEAVLVVNGICFRNVITTTINNKIEKISKQILDTSIVKICAPIFVQFNLYLCNINICLCCDKYKMR